MGWGDGVDELTATNVVDAVFAAVRTDPARDGVNVDAVTNEDAFLAHCSLKKAVCCYWVEYLDHRLVRLYDA